MKIARILYGATDFGVSHFSADMLWRTKFKAPDPFLFVEIHGRGYLFASSLEIGRAQKEASADKIIPLEIYLVKGKGSLAEALSVFLKEFNVRKVFVSHEFPYVLGKVLARRFKFEIQKPFFPKRAQKTLEEIAEIEAAQHAAEQSLLKARAILKKSVIRGSRIYHRKRIVTSEFLRAVIEEELFRRGYLAIGTIVSSGIQAADPHDRGRGPIIPHTPIVFDIFPVSRKEHYYGDLSRTLFKGKPSEGYKKMYEAVRMAQESALKKLRPGRDTASLYFSTLDYFNSKGFSSSTGGNSPEGFTPTPKSRRCGFEGGRNQGLKDKQEYSHSKSTVWGFIHGLGHGVGIDIHEYPSLGSASISLKKGNEVTIEPGLYYQTARKRIPAGGIRIEDTVVVTGRGCKNLTSLPRSFRWAVIF